MKRWIKRGICTLSLVAMLSVNALAAELSLSFDQHGTTAGVELRDVGGDRYAAEITLALRGMESVQFHGKAEVHAMTVDSAAGTITLYVASQTPLSVSNGTLDLGTLTITSGTQVTRVLEATVLDRSLKGITYEDVALKVTTNNGTVSGGTSSGGQPPTVSVQGNGGKVQATSDGTVIIHPDDGYRIARILVNGKEVAVTNRLTGLKSTDRVEVIFEKENTSKTAFTDVHPSDWYADAVDYAVSHGLFRGISETTFGPNLSMSRAMLVTVLHRMAGEQSAPAAGFTDIPANAWYADAVAWAASNGIVQGVSDSRFAPDVPVTREQMATILHRYARFAGVNGTETGTALDDFRDAASVSGYAVSAMEWAVKCGLISGVGNQTLAPGGSATRAQVAAILQRYVESVAK